MLHHFLVAPELWSPLYSVAPRLWFLCAPWFVWQAVTLVCLIFEFIWVLLQCGAFCVFLVLPPNKGCLILLSAMPASTSGSTRIPAPNTTEAHFKIENFPLFLPSFLFLLTIAYCQSQALKPGRHLESAINLMCVFLICGRKPAYLENHAGEYTSKALDLEWKPNQRFMTPNLCRNSTNQLKRTHDGELEIHTLFRPLFKPFQNWQ